MQNMQIVVLTLAVLGCLLCVFGYLIKFKEKINLIAGINSKTIHKVKDKGALASLVGGSVLVLGVLFCAGALTMYMKPANKGLVEIVLLLGVLAALSIVFTKAKKYVD